MITYLCEQTPVVDARLGELELLLPELELIELQQVRICVCTWWCKRALCIDLISYLLQRPTGEGIC